MIYAAPAGVSLFASSQICFQVCSGTAIFPFEPGHDATRRLRDDRMRARMPARNRAGVGGQTGILTSIEIPRDTERTGLAHQQPGNEPALEGERQRDRGCTGHREQRETDAPQRLRTAIRGHGGQRRDQRRGDGNQDQRG